MERKTDEKLQSKLTSIAKITTEVGSDLYMKSLQ